jgi:hypothetical protein
VLTQGEPAAAGYHTRFPDRAHRNFWRRRFPSVPWLTVTQRSASMVGSMYGYGKRVKNFGYCGKCRFRKPAEQAWMVIRPPPKFTQKRPAPSSEEVREPPQGLVTRLVFLEEQCFGMQQGGHITQRVSEVELAEKRPALQCGLRVSRK